MGPITAIAARNKPRLKSRAHDEPRRFGRGTGVPFAFVEAPPIHQPSGGVVGGMQRARGHGW